LQIAGSDGKSYAIIAEMPRFPPPPGSQAPWIMNVVRLLAVLTVSGLICYLLARYLTAPILKLGAATQRLAAGDLSTRVSPTLGSRNDEISRLALDFDHMAERIESLVNSQRILLARAAFTPGASQCSAGAVPEWIRSGCGEITGPDRAGVGQAERYDRSSVDLEPGRIRNLRHGNYENRPGEDDPGNRR
jgi:HAMP domain-containing protein